MITREEHSKRVAQIDELLAQLSSMKLVVNSYYGETTDLDCKTGGTGLTKVQDVMRNKKQQVLDSILNLHADMFDKSVHSVFVSNVRTAILFYEQYLKPEQYYAFAEPAPVQLPLFKFESKEQLSDFLNTALAGNANLYIDLPNKSAYDHDKCITDNAAEVLIAGGQIVIGDTEDEVEPKHISLEDIIAGLEKCRWSDKRYEHAAYEALINDELDIETADILLQVVAYGEVIFG